MKPDIRKFSLFFLGYFVVLQFGADLVVRIVQPDARWWFLAKPSVLFTGLLSFYVQSLVIYLLLVKYYPKRGIWFCLPLIVLSIPMLIGSRYFIQEVLGPLFFGEGNYAPGYTLRYYFVDNLYFTGLYILPSVIFFFITYSRFQESLRNELVLSQTKAELSYLKSQINPHFLFNSLNNIYSLVNQNSKQSLPAIEKLSMLMRYMLYQKNDFVPVVEELNYLRNYIDLQRMRYENLPGKIEMNEREGLQLPPLTLIPLVENAFKHGSFRNESEPLIIRLDWLDEKKMYFMVENSISSGSKDSDGGVGLSNVKRRLDILYPGKYLLETSLRNKRYKTELTIELN